MTNINLNNQDNNNSNHNNNNNNHLNSLNSLNKIPKFLIQINIKIIKKFLILNTKSSITKINN